MSKGCALPSNQPTRIAWDTTVVIDCLQKKAGRYEWIKPLILEAEEGNIMIVVSSMAMTETFKINGVAPEDELRIIEGFFDRTYIHPESTSTHIAEISRSLRRQYPLEAIDSIHIASAVGTNCPYLLTNDGDNPKKKKPILPLDRKIPIKDGVLRIMTPRQYHEMMVAEANPILRIPREEDNEQAKETKPQKGGA